MLFKECIKKSKEMGFYTHMCTNITYIYMYVNIYTYIHIIRTHTYAYPVLCIAFFLLTLFCKLTHIKPSWQIL